MGDGGRAGLDEVFNLGGEGASFGDGAAGKGDGGERSGGLGEGAAGAGEGGGRDSGAGGEGRGGAAGRFGIGRGIEAELDRAEIAAGRIFSFGEAVGRWQRTAVARPAAVVVDDGLEELGGGVGHGGRDRLSGRYKSSEHAGAEAEQTGEDQAGDLGRELAEEPNFFREGVSG